MISLRPDQGHQAGARGEFRYDRRQRLPGGVPTLTELARRAIDSAGMRLGCGRACSLHGVIPFAEVGIPGCNSDQHAVFDLSLAGWVDAILTG